MQIGTTAVVVIKVNKKGGKDLKYIKKYYKWIFAFAFFIEAIRVFFGVSNLSPVLQGIVLLCIGLNFLYEAIDTDH